jgi:hypothetical protein
MGHVFRSEVITKHLNIWILQEEFLSKYGVRHQTATTSNCRKQATSSSRSNLTKLSLCTDDENSILSKFGVPLRLAMANELLEF